MAQADLPAVAALERESYVFPWNDQIFADCLRVGYHCVVVELRGRVGLRRTVDGSGGGARAQSLHHRAMPPARRRPGPAGRASRHARDRGSATHSSRYAARIAPRSRCITASDSSASARAAATTRPGMAARTHWSIGSSWTLRKRGRSPLRRGWTSYPSATIARPARSHHDPDERRNRPPTQLCDHLAP